MLTGLERYAWERAGFFIRRGAIGPGAIQKLLANRPSAVDGDVPTDLLEPVLADPGVAAVLVDLIGAHVGILSAQILNDVPPHAWGRGGDVRLTAPPLEQIAQLAGEAQTLVLIVALTHAERLYVLPGTHTQAPTPEQVDCLNARVEDVPGQVRIRLAAGDALFRDGRLACRTAECAGEWAQCGFAVTNRRPYTSVESIADCEWAPEAIRSAFRAALSRPPGEPGRR